MQIVRSLPNVSSGPFRVTVSASGFAEQSLQRLERRQRATLDKLDRGYDDYASGRMPEEMWTRKSKEWEHERRTIEAELSQISRQNPCAVVTGKKIIELAKQAYLLYKTKDPAEQRKLLETMLSNCTLDTGSLCPTYSKPFDLLVRGNETGDWLGGRESLPRLVETPIKTGLFS